MMANVSVMKHEVSITVLSQQNDLNNHYDVMNNTDVSKNAYFAPTI